MGDSPTQAVLEAHTADYLAGYLGQDDQLAWAIKMVLNPLPLLLLGEVEFVRFNQKVRRLRKDGMAVGDQPGGIFGLG